MSRNSQIGRDLPPGVEEAMQSGLAGYSLKQDKNHDLDTVEYHLDLGPFQHVLYSTVNEQLDELDYEELSWLTQPQDLNVREPEIVIEIAEKVIEIREAMAGLGYSFELTSENPEYGAILAKPVPIEALPDELGKVKEQFGNWNW